MSYFNFPSPVRAFGRADFHVRPNDSERAPRMKGRFRTVMIVLFVSWFAGRLLAAAESRLGQDAPARSTSNHKGSVTFPNLTNAVQFRLYTNSSPDSLHLFNTVEIEG